jgi:hypothetical protein
MNQTIETDKVKKIDAGTIARNRFERYIADKLSDSWDEERWEFYTFLLEQAKKHDPDPSGYMRAEYKQDQDEARRRNSAK